MRVLVAQLNPTIGDFEKNTRKMIQALDHARKERAEIVLFSELSISGYPPEDLVLHTPFINAAEESLKKIIAASEGLFVVAGLPRHNTSQGEKPLLNSAAVIYDKKLLGYYDKRLLPTYDVFDEARYFEPGTEAKIWEFKGKKIAVTICEDIWGHAGEVDYTKYQCDPIVELKQLKPDLHLNLSASPYHFQKPELRMRVCAKSAKTLGCPTILCAQVGANDALVFDGYSMVVDEKGELRQLAKGFEEDEMLVDLNVQTPFPSLRYEPIHDLYRALVLGVRDYFHKSGFAKGCVGLSGGVDSSLVVCIAAEALGKENVLGVLMPSRFTSPSSVEDAKALAKNLGIKVLDIPIEGPFCENLELLEPFFENRAWDATEENIQSRVRGTILMAISNKLGYIVLSTGNKSELALGFCTLYGDMCGGLSVIADVTKHQVYALCGWINREKEVIPRSVIEKEPTAELRPNQKDTDTLPPYPVVDAVLEGYVEEHLSAEAIAKKHNIPVDVVIDLIHRIHKAEYKRRQAAPGIRVSKKSFTVGRRYPIVERWM